MHGHYDEPTFSSSSRRRGRRGGGSGVDWRPRPLDHLRSGANHPGVGRVYYRTISRLRRASVRAWRSFGLGAPATPANFYLLSAIFRSTIQPIPSVMGPRVVRFTDQSNSARSGAFDGCTGHWDETWESTTCSARCSARRSQYVDFHWLRNLWDRSFRSACLLRRAVFCQLRAGVVAIERKKNPHGGCAEVYLFGP